MVNLPSAVVRVSLSASEWRATSESPSFEEQGFEQAARAPRVTGGAAADADGVVALRVAVEERVEGHDAEELGERDAGSGGDVFEIGRAEVLARVALLDGLQDSEKRARAPCERAMRSSMKACLPGSAGSPATGAASVCVTALY